MLTYEEKLIKIDLMAMMRSAFLAISVIFATLFLGTLYFISYPFDRAMKMANCLSRLWARWILWASGATVEIKGLEKIDFKRPYVFAANHQSYLDIPAILKSFPFPIKMIAKASLFRIPFFGQAIRLAGFISIDRTKGKDAYKSLKEALWRINEGISILVFPEGMRSPDGNVGSFKSGAFFLASKSKVPLVPVSISGTYNILPRGAKLVRPGLVRINIEEPIPVKDVRDKGKFMEEVRQIIIKNLEI